MTGFINLIKPEGMSSAYAVGAVKKKLNIACGHMGTLDPMASGVLPVGVGQASRLFNFTLDKEKTYVAKFRFGELTDTLDTTGTVTCTTNHLPTLKEISEVLVEFVGVIDQVPPNYSAKCIDGKRGYQLARRGLEFTLPPKKVTILGYNCLRQIDEKEFEFEIKCKGGTYIRSLARDLGTRLNSLAVMSSLCRTQSGAFTLDNAVTVEEFKNSDNPTKYLLPADTAVNFDKLVLTGAQAQKMLDGVYENHGFLDGVYRVYNGNAFWGVGTVRNNILKMNAYVRG